MAPSGRPAGGRSGQGGGLAPCDRVKALAWRGEAPEGYELPEPGALPVLYVFDLHCWIHRYHATMGGRAAHGFIEFVGRVLEEKKPTHVAVARDYPHPTFRHKLAPNVYKANRSVNAPDPQLLERIRWAHELLEDVHGIPVYGVPGFEADDIIATICREAEMQLMNVVIVGMDKDLMQLIHGGPSIQTKCFMWDGKHRVIGPNSVHNKFGVEPEQMEDYLAIVGDGVDCVPGVKGLGPRAAREILKTFNDVPEALACARAVEARDELHTWPLPDRYRRLLLEQEAQLRKSLTLVRLESHVDQRSDVKFNFDDMRYRW